MEPQKVLYVRITDYTRQLDGDAALPEKLWPLPLGITKVRRAEGNEAENVFFRGGCIFLRDPRISRDHGVLDYRCEDPLVLYYRDTSTNGTISNRKKIRDKEVVIKPGDSLGFGRSGDRPSYNMEFLKSEPTE